MLKYLAVVGALCAVALTVTVALMIGPTTWAVLLGIVFGGLASLPMLFVVVLLLRRPPAPPPPGWGYPPPGYTVPAATPTQRGVANLPASYALPAAPPPVNYRDEGVVDGDYYFLPAEGR